MKELLALFLAFYVVGLTLMPCIDQEMTCQVQAQIQTSSQTSGSHESHSDSCSPFCHCSCCHISMEVGAPLVIPSVMLPVRTLAFNYRGGIFSDFSVPVWEPPKTLSV